MNVCLYTKCTCTCAQALTIWLLLTECEVINVAVLINPQRREIRKKNHSTTTFGDIVP